MNTAVREKAADRRTEQAPKKDQKPAGADGALPVDVSALSTETLKALSAAVQAELEGRSAKEREGFIASIRDQAAKLGLNVSEVVAALARRSGGRRAGTDRRSAVAPKYRNPSNPAETWAGRGAKPKWVQEALKAGAKLEDLAIPSS